MVTAPQVCLGVGRAGWNNDDFLQQKSGYIYCIDTVSARRLASVVEEEVTVALFFFATVS